MAKDHHETLVRRRPRLAAHQRRPGRGNAQGDLGGDEPGLSPASVSVLGGSAAATSKPGFRGGSSGVPMTH